MYPHVDGFEQFTTDESMKDITMQDVCDYLNAVLAKYGPPCNFCKNFKDGLWCLKKQSHREYDMLIGPYSTWNIKKKCKYFKDDDFDNNDESRFRSALDCNIQTYGSNVHHNIPNEDNR